MTDQIGKGHVCPHGIRWPWACQPCDDEAWDRHKREQEGQLPDAAASDAAVRSAA